MKKSGATGKPLSKFSDHCRHKWTLLDYQAFGEGLGVIVVKCTKCKEEHYYTKRNMTVKAIESLKKIVESYLVATISIQTPIGKCIS